MWHVFYRPIYGTVPRVYNGTSNVCFLRINRELWVEVDRSVVMKSLIQVHTSWINEEAWYSFFMFSTLATLLGLRWKSWTNKFPTLRANWRRWIFVWRRQETFERHKVSVEALVTAVVKLKNPLRNRSARTARTMRQYKNGPTKSNKLLTKIIIIIMMMIIILMIIIKFI